jgi:Protein of unknown function (DUF1326)
LDWLLWLTAAMWPGPLHERNGRAVVFLDESASDGQRQALEAIATGKVGGPIGIFMTRPAGASDQAVKDLVAQALKQCAVVPAQSVADCPQSLLSVARGELDLIGDPLYSATVNFDQNNGQFTVRGNFAMTVSHMFFSTPKTDSSFNTTYVAYLFWNGQSLQLITINGSD